LYLGAAAVPSHAAPTAPAASAAAQLHGVNLLVVEDDPDTRDLLREILSVAGADVVTAPDAARALTALDARLPHAVLCDIGLPGEDGYTLMRRIRGRAPDAGGAVPAIALTAYARREDRDKALAAGFLCHAVKPIDPEALTRVVADVVAGRAADTAEP
jgi:CheY-like chemotaxis protein